MNFFAHAVFAARRDQDPRWILGSMAPDFATMAGMRLIRVEGDEVLARGVAFHHRSDDAFHGAPIFVELMEEARIELEERGLGFGPAAAIGHVGVELLLDGVMVDSFGVHEGYRQAIAGAGEHEQHMHFHDMGRFESSRRWRMLCTRLAAAPLPEGYREPDFVADRLIMILSSRPTLAVRPGDESEVHSWAARWRGRVAARSEALLDQVEDRLRSLI